MSQESQHVYLRASHIPLALAKGKAGVLEDWDEDRPGYCFCQIMPFVLEGSAVSIAAFSIA
jgi:hypothetical protein